MADPDSNIVNAPKLPKSDSRVKKREPKAGKAFDTLSCGVRRSVRLVIAESLECARAATAKATTPTPPASSSSSSLSSLTSGTRSTRSTRFTRPVLFTPSTPSATSTMSTPTSLVMTPCTNPKTSEQDGPYRSPLIPTQRKNWYRIRGIISEASRGGKTRYLVEWDGYDPSTGMDWPAEWVSDVAASLSSISWPFADP